MAMRESTKKTLVGDCLKALHKLGIACWRQNSGGLRNAKGSYVQFSPPGTPDILGIIQRVRRKGLAGSPVTRIHEGVFFGCECKTGRGKLNPDQLAFQTNVRAVGVICLEVRSVGDMIDQLREAGAL